MKRLLVSSLVWFVCVACAPAIATRIPAGVILPDHAMQVKAPDAGVPKAQAEFLGIWVGHYDGSARGVVLSVVEVWTGDRALAWWARGEAPDERAYFSQKFGTFEGNTLVVRDIWRGRPWTLWATLQPGGWLNVRTSEGSWLRLTRYRPEGS